MTWITITITVTILPTMKKIGDIVYIGCLGFLRNTQWCKTGSNKYANKWNCTRCLKKHQSNKCQSVRNHSISSKRNMFHTCGLATAMSLSRSQDSRTRTKTRTCGPRTRTKGLSCKLVLKDPRGQGLSRRTTTLSTTEDLSHSWHCTLSHNRRPVTQLSHSWHCTLSHNTRGYHGLYGSTTCCISHWP